MDLSKYDVEIKRHALLQALARGIDPDMVEQAMLKGKMERFGNDGVRFINKGSKRTIICVGQMVGTKIKIFTIEEGN